MYEFGSIKDIIILNCFFSYHRAKKNHRRYLVMPPQLKQLSNFLHKVLLSLVMARVTQGDLIGHWLLDGSDVGLRHENSPIVEVGFYPGTRATAYDKFSECYTEIPVMIDLRGKSFTIAAWIKIKAKLQITQTIISDWADPQQFTFALSSSQRLLFKRYYKDGTPNQILSSKVVSIGRWYHVAVTFDKESGLVRLYLDTIEIESLVFDMKEWRGPSSKPIIGDSLSTAFPDQKFSGAIMDVYVFGVVKSGGELDDLRAPLDERMVFQHLPGSLTGHVISSHTEFDHRLCMVLCARTSACVSFNHRPDGGICQLKNGTKREYPGDFITSNGFQYYEKLEFTLIPWK
ncbi:uncharacterized protein LOC5517003 isoform X3 [Nematostella vectensis]|uniref:uncharacterized protein LOC5517003 isoform X3 n=1 Tax=Nematostella vectensis TaxID=45351 RepID=UPI0020773260|nr:uncharacterized protein LOC5517003 isoform X3 [Nematostella vectensis]